MIINKDKVSTVVRFIDSLLQVREINNIENEELISDYINEAIGFTGVILSYEEIEAINRDIAWRYKIFTTPGEAIVCDYEQVDWYTEIKDQIDFRFWSRYKNYLIDEKDFSPNVVSTLGEDTLDQKLMNYLGNPNSENAFLRRGLIIGDVQSGKTSTYIGLMCKAADAGYKVFILLTGTIETLRKQTQERVEEGFIGINLTNGGQRVGVGLDNKEIFAMSMTSRSSDFVGIKDEIAVSLKSHQAIVFVVKKNMSVLKKLKDWLIKLNGKKIDVPMLLIDDEADNASINTNKPEDDPTVINKLIRELVDVFTKSNYVGFTATPFANVFIDPKTTEEMENHDLFPEDFIISLPVSSNYIGPTEIYSKDGKYKRHLEYVKDAGKKADDGYSFYFMHKKFWEDSVPGSLKDSIYTFYLANAIRDLRGDVKKHRSMLINMSRFVAVQNVIKVQVENIHNSAYRAIKFNASLNFNDCMQDPILNQIYIQWDKHYSELEFTWDQIIKVLFDSIESIQIKVINSAKNSEKLDYPQNESLRVIAIGGLALSRGLTLEGLVTSYFYRNTSTYDVLMQMGRWFGYRYGYADLFRIWTHATSAKWYAEISEATDHLKADMSVMREQKLKPKDFGIRVRNDSTELKITARNKMRYTKDEFEFISYFGTHIETPYLSSHPDAHKNNYNKIQEFIKNCLADGHNFERRKYSGSGEHFILKKVTKNNVIKLLNQMQLSHLNTVFNVHQINEFLTTYPGGELNLWDIAFMEGAKNQENEMDLLGRKLYKVSRKTCLIDRTSGHLSVGRKGKVGGPTDGLMGIEITSIIEEAKSEYKVMYKKEKKEEFSTGKNYPSDTWFKFISNRNPLLLVYFIDVDTDPDEGKSEAMESFKNELGNIPVTALALGFPRNITAAVKGKYRYKVNIRYNPFEQINLKEGTEE